MAEELEIAGFDRRSMIKKAAIGAGVVWAAPVIDAVIASPAGAQSSTQTCYFVKYQDTGCSGSVGGGDPCPDISGQSGGSGCGQGHFSVSFSGGSITITRNDANCVLTGLYFKSASSCSGNQASGFPAGGTFSKDSFSPATNPQGGKQDFSHVNISYCCN